MNKAFAPLRQGAVEDYTTSDLYFAAYLKAVGLPMKHHDKGPSGKVTFIFDAEVGNIGELRQAYFNGTGKVAAVTFASEIRNLKAICHM